jgi:hypothetical protein
MPTEMSAAAWFRAAHGRTVIKRVTGVQTTENWPEMAADARRQLEAQGCPADQIKADETGLHWPGGFLLSPKFKALEYGLMTARSADYGFTGEGADRPTWGDKKGAAVEAGRLTKRYPNGATITFEIA